MRHDAFFWRRPSQPLAPREINKGIILHDHLLFEAIETDLALNTGQVHAPQTHERDGHSRPTSAEQFKRQHCPHPAVPAWRGRRIVAPPPFRAAEARVVFYPVRVVAAPGHRFSEEARALLDSLARSDKAQELAGLEPPRRLLAELRSQFASSF